MPTTEKQYDYVRLTGPMSVVPATPEDVKRKNLWVYLLMGPTGSGKSAFIESLSPGQALGISKDSLESVTKGVVCYRVVNLTCYRSSALLVDTPGFLDTKLSESRITRMITETLDSLRQSSREIFVQILYFQPITDIRMGGSKRDAVKLFGAFAESFGASGIAVVTTMWNHISSPKKIQDANNRFSDLESEIFRSSNRLVYTITKFEFSSDSALSILDYIYARWNHDEYTSQNIDSQYQSLILNNLLLRISNIQQQLLALAEDKQNATTPGKGDPLLLEVVLRDESVALSTLQSFLDDLYEINPETYFSLPLRQLPLHVAIKYQLRRFVIAGKRVFRKHT